MHVTYATKKTKEGFVLRCANQECRGFLMNGWKCNLCNAETCDKCYEVVDSADHVCEKDRVETIAMINKDTKPCPSCGEGISKVDGCDQMWCIKCHTAFSWNTGKIENQYIHNPEFFRYNRDHNIPNPPPPNQFNPNDVFRQNVVDGIEIDVTENMIEDAAIQQINMNRVRLPLNLLVETMAKMVKQTPYIATTYHTAVNAYYGRLTEIATVFESLRNEMNGLNTNLANLNRNDRIRYMVGIIDREQFIDAVLQNGTTVEKHVAMKGVLMQCLKGIMASVANFYNRIRRNQRDEIAPMQEFVDILRSHNALSAEQLKAIQVSTTLPVTARCMESLDKLEKEIAAINKRSETISIVRNARIIMEAR